MDNDILLQPASIFTVSGTGYELEILKVSCTTKEHTKKLLAVVAIQLIRR